ncbi:MAG TPA: hypothetical protein VMT28_10225 [Terriglobales bacterium]|jgi:hypothetical protein|nr:hypothetical protein [Terriglobales bacterium]
MLKSIRKTLCVAGLVVLSAAMLSAQGKPKVAHNNNGKSHGSVVLYTNFVGAYPFWDTTSGYFVDGANFFNQVIAQGFRVSNTGPFADTALALGIYKTGGSASYVRVKTYLMSDAGGVPGSILDGPLTQQYRVQPFENGRGGGIVQFNCVTCPTLNGGSSYWIAALQDQARVEDTWDFSFSDFSSPFAFNQTGTLTGWYAVPSGYIRSAYQADGN